MTDWQTDRQTDRQTDWLTDWQTDWLTDWQTDWQTDRQTDWLTDWHESNGEMWRVALVQPMFMKFMSGIEYFVKPPEQNFMTMWQTVYSPTLSHKRTEGWWGSPCKAAILRPKESTDRQTAPREAHTGHRICGSQCYLLHCAVLLYALHLYKQTHLSFVCYVSVREIKFFKV